jgi:hypothetical protein
MGFEATERVWYGDDARRIRSVARQALIDFLSDTLNDEGGPYYTALGLGEPIEGSEDGELLEVIVTKSREHASKLFDGGDGTPVVFVMLGPVESTPSGKTVGGVYYRGERHDLTLILDMGVNQRTDDAENPVVEAENDSEFADFVFDAVSRGRYELSQVGLHGVSIQSDAEQQRAGNGRNPHTVTCFVTTLDNYAA